MKTIDLDRIRDKHRDDTAAPAERATPDAAPRKVMRKAAGTGTGSLAADSAIVPWAFGDAVNIGVHAPIARHGDGAVAGGADTLVARAAEGSGHAIPGALRGKFEASLGTDLGGVRVHDHAESHAASAALGARAYAVGQDVYMGAGAYSPDSADGAWLLAHEVAHTVQQRGATAGPMTKLEVSNTGDAMEIEADTAATAMMSGAPASVGSMATGIARQAHGAPGQATALTPAQQQAMTAVQQGGANLNREHLLGLARTLSAAWSAQPAHSDQRRTVAQALVRLYDIFDNHLAAEFERGTDDGQMAWEFPEFSMIDPWQQDAHEPAHTRHRPHRRQQPRASSTPAAATATAAPPAGTPPPAANANTLEQNTGPAQPGQVVEPGNSNAHVAAVGLEALSHVAEAVEMVTESFAAGIAGMAMGAVATIVSAILTIAAGDELGEKLGEGQHYIFNFCMGYAHTIRGEAGGAGHGASDGARFARQAIAQLGAQHLDASALRNVSMFRLYGIAWRRVQGPVRQQLSAASEHVFPGHGGAAADAAVNATAGGGIAYQAFGGP